MPPRSIRTLIIKSTPCCIDYNTAFNIFVNFPQGMDGEARLKGKKLVLILKRPPYIFYLQHTHRELKFLESFLDMFSSFLTEMARGQDVINDRRLVSVVDLSGFHQRI